MEIPGDQQGWRSVVRLRPLFSALLGDQYTLIHAAVNDLDTCTWRIIKDKICQPGTYTTYYAPPVNPVSWECVTTAWQGSARLRAFRPSGRCVKYKLQPRIMRG